MDNLSIPNNRKKSFEFLINLTDSEKNQLIKEFEEAPPGMLQNSLSEYLKLRLEFEYKQIHEVVDLIFELYSLIETVKVDAFELSEDIVKELKDEDSFPKDKDYTSFQDMLYKLLTLKTSVGITHRAGKLSNNYENVFRFSRIITDIRPVFKTDNSEEIETSLLIHNLKITYSKNGKSESIYFALDNEDLNKLKETITRAEKKESVLKNSFNESKFMNFIK